MNNIFTFGFNDHSYVSFFIHTQTLVFVQQYVFNLYLSFEKKAFRFSLTSNNVCRLFNKNKYAFLVSDDDTLVLTNRC